MLTDKTLKSSLDNGALLSVYIVGGEDIFLKKQALDRIIKKTVDPDDEMNLIRYGYGVNLQEVYDELSAFPFMAEKKCVILSDFEIDDAPKADFEKLCEIARERYETSVFVLYFGNYELVFNKSARLKKLISAVESAGGDLVRLDHKPISELTRLLSSSAKKRGLELSLKNAEYLIETCSQDISVLSDELSKLCAFKKTGEITRDDIDSVCVKSIEASVYDLSSKIINGDTAAAMRVLDELSFMNIDEVPILYSISDEFVNMYRALSAKNAGKNPLDLTRDFNMGNRAFTMKYAVRDIRKYDEKKLALSLEAIVAAERELKSNFLDGRLVLQKLVVKLIYIMKTGEPID